MKAIICNSFGPPSNLTFGELPDPKPSPGEILIDIKACSVNFPDTLIIQGLYQFKPPFPFSPGADVAGVVLAVGEDVKRFKPGDEVVGMSTHGGFAEKVALPAANCFPKPPGMNMIAAASFLLAYGTSYYALKDRAQLKEGQTLLVLGASGGVGLTAVELGKLMGAKVIAAASSEEKLALCKNYGADELINYDKENLKERVKALTNGKGVHAILDPVGAQYSEAALRSIGWEGNYLVVGFAAGQIPKIPLNLVLLKSCQITGVFYGAFMQKFPQENLKNVMQLVQWFNEKKLNPHIEAIFALPDAARALEQIMQRKAKGKLVVTME